MNNLNYGHTFKISVELDHDQSLSVKNFDHGLLWPKIKPFETEISTRFFEYFVFFRFEFLESSLSLKFALIMYIPLKISRKTQNKLDNLGSSAWASAQGNTVDKLSPKTDTVISSGNKQECIITENTRSLI